MKHKKRKALRGRRNSRSRRGGTVKKKWTPIDARTAEKLAGATSQPGVVFPLPASALPSNIQQMPGAVSYFVSAYTAPVSVAPGITAGGEMVVVRTEGDLAKAYNYVFATSSGGQVCFNGPYKHFDQHHFASSSAVPVGSLFGHTPIRKP